MIIFGASRERWGRAGVGLEVCRGSRCVGGGAMRSRLFIAYNTAGQALCVARHGTGPGRTGSQAGPRCLSLSPARLPTARRQDSKGTPSSRNAKSVPRPVETYGPLAACNASRGRLHRLRPPRAVRILLEILSRVAFACNEKILYILLDIDII